MTGANGNIRRRARSLLPDRHTDGRLVVIVALTAYLTVVAVGRLIWHVDLWRVLGVPTAPSLFYDARNVAAAAECRGLGYDPLVENPCDPEARPMIYPRVWLLLRFLGLREAQTPVFGGFVVLLFLVSVLLLMRRLSLVQGAVVALAVCSPAVMFAVERGNMDLVLFSLFVLAVFLWRAGATMPLAPVIVLVAAIAKLYALFALPAFVFAVDRRVRWTVAACFVVLAAYGIVTLEDIDTVTGAAEGGLLYSYGVRILPGYLYHKIMPDQWQGGRVAAQAIAVVPLLAGATMVWVQARRRIWPCLWQPMAWRSPALLAFHLGVLVYMGTFAARKNGDYRLVFLLLTLPQLFRWTASESSRSKTLARVAVVTVVAALWVGSLSMYVAPFDEVASWAVAAALIPLLAGSLPRLHAAPPWWVDRLGRRCAPGGQRGRGQAAHRVLAGLSHPGESRTFGKRDLRSSGHNKVPPRRRRGWGV